MMSFLKYPFCLQGICITTSLCMIVVLWVSKDSSAKTLMGTSSLAEILNNNVDFRVTCAVIVSVSMVVGYSIHENVPFFYISSFTLFLLSFPRYPPYHKHYSSTIQWIGYSGHHIQHNTKKNKIYRWMGANWSFAGRLHTTDHRFTFTIYTYRFFGLYIPCKF